MARRWAAVGLLLAWWGLLIVGAAHTDLTADEGRAAYVVRDALPMNLAPREALRALRANVSQMLDRAAALPLAGQVQAFALDGWGAAAGETIFAARLLWKLPLLVAVALGMRILRRLPRRGWLAVQMALLGAGLALTVAAPPPPPWSTALHTLNAQRTPFAPLIIAYPDDHPLAYYDRQPATHFRHGITLDLGWRAFSDAERQRALAALGDSAVWIIAPAEGDALAGLLPAAHVPASRVVVGDMQIVYAAPPDR